MMDPHQVTVSLDITLNNPLSQNEEVSHMTSHDPHVTSHDLLQSPWNRFFQDNELRQLVSQDVVRTFPDIEFFREDDIQ